MTKNGVFRSVTPLQNIIRCAMLAAVASIIASILWLESPRGEIATGPAYPACLTFTVGIPIAEP